MEWMIKIPPEKQELLLDWVDKSLEKLIKVLFSSFMTLKATSLFLL